MTPGTGDLGAARGRLGWLAAALIVGVLAGSGLAIAGCGDDNDSVDTGTSSSTENTPTGETTTTSTTTGDTTTTSTEQSESGGTGAYDPEEDTEDNDIAPPEGSQAEELEEECEKNPGACE